MTSIRHIRSVWGGPQVADNALRPVSLVLAALGLLTTLASLCVAIVSDLDPTFFLVGVSGGGGCCIVGGLILDHRPSNAVGWAFILNGVLLAVDSFASASAASDPLHVSHVLYAQLWTTEVLDASVPLLLFLFPDGRLPSRGWRPVFSVYLASVVTLPAVPALLGLDRQEEYLAYLASLEVNMPSSLHDVESWALVSEGVATFFMLIGLVSLVQRARRADPQSRARLVLVAWAVGFLVAVLGISLLIPVTPVVEVIWVVAPVPFFLAVLVAMRVLLGVDRIVRPALAYSVGLTVMALSYSIVAVAVGVVLGGAAQRSPVAVGVATLAAAATGRPVVRHVRRVLDRQLDRRAWLAVRQIDDFAARVASGMAQPDEVQVAMAAALGDPGLFVVYGSPGRLVDVGGRSTAPSVQADGRTRVPVVVRGRQIAEVDVDAAVAAEAGIVDAVLAAARLILENAALQASASVHVAALRAASERIVRAGDDERRRLERDLHDGAQQRLVALTMKLRVAEDRLRATSGEAALVLSQTVDELRATLVELRSLTNGMLPAALVDEGLGVALRGMALRSPVPITLDVRSTRLPATAEATIWFFVSEAVANATKHARSERIHVSVRADTEQATVLVRDDGIGGAELAKGTGLQGLADRLEAIGGRFRLTSAPGSGTVLEGWVPCAL